MARPSLSLLSATLLAILLVAPGATAQSLCQPEPFGGLDPPDDGVTLEQAVSDVQAACAPGDTLLLLIPRVARNMDILQDVEIIAAHLCDLSGQVLVGGYSKEKRWQVLVCNYPGPKAAGN